MKKCCPYKLLKQARSLADQGKDIVLEGAQDLPVSYTHLTLPTICSV